MSAGICCFEGQTTGCRRILCSFSKEQNIPWNLVNSYTYLYIIYIYILTYTYLYIHNSKLDVFVNIGEGKILKVTTQPYKETSLEMWRHFCTVPVEKTHYTFVCTVHFAFRQFSLSHSSAIQFISCWYFLCGMLNYTYFHSCNLQLYVIVEWW